jgi:hypothetical protein
MRGLHADIHNPAQRGDFFNEQVNMIKLDIVALVTHMGWIQETVTNSHSNSRHIVTNSHSSSCQTVINSHSNSCQTVTNIHSNSSQTVTNVHSNNRQSDK